MTDSDYKVTEYVLALPTLGDATRNRNNPICVMQPEATKASTMVGVAVAVAGVIAINSANVNTALKQYLQYYENRPKLVF